MANHYLKRDQEVLDVLTWLIQDGGGYPVIHLTPENIQMIVNMTHNAEHRGSVFKEMNNLPKCQACGSVSELCFIAFVRFCSLVR